MPTALQHSMYKAVHSLCSACGPAPPSSQKLTRVLQRCTCHFSVTISILLPLLLLLLLLLLAAASRPITRCCCCCCRAPRRCRPRKVVAGRVCGRCRAVCTRAAAAGVHGAAAAAAAGCQRSQQILRLLTCTAIRVKQQQQQQHDTPKKQQQWQWWCTHCHRLPIRQIHGRCFTPATQRSGKVAKRTLNRAFKSAVTVVNCTALKIHSMAAAVPAHRCKVLQPGWEFSLVFYPGSTPVGNATLVVANVLMCNTLSQHRGMGTHTHLAARAGLQAPLHTDTAAQLPEAQPHSCCGGTAGPATHTPACFTQKGRHEQGQYERAACRGSAQCGMQVVRALLASPHIHLHVLKTERNVS
jgi:hypothetical protein